MYVYVLNIECAEACEEYFFLAYEDAVASEEYLVSLFCERYFGSAELNEDVRTNIFVFPLLTSAFKPSESATWDDLRFFGAFFIPFILSLLTDVVPLSFYSMFLS